MEKQNIRTNPIYAIIHTHNSSSDRKWIYTYNLDSEIIDSILHIIRSPLYKVVVENENIKTTPNNRFSNRLLLNNIGWSPLVDFYYEEYNRYTSCCKALYSSGYVFPHIQPGKTAELVMDFEAPSVPGCYKIYILLKNTHQLLKLEDALVTFKVTVLPNNTKDCEISVLDPIPCLGESFIHRHLFEQTWTLKNNTLYDWEYIELVKQNENVAHLFSLKESKKRYFNIKAGSVFQITISFSPPDVAGSYISVWKLFKPDGSEFSIDIPLHCIIQTKYEALPQYQMRGEPFIQKGIWERLKELWRIKL